MMQRYDGNGGAVSPLSEAGTAAGSNPGDGLLPPKHPAPAANAGVSAVEVRLCSLAPPGPAP